MKRQQKKIWMIALLAMAATGMSGCSDEDKELACKRGQRARVTLDHIAKGLDLSLKDPGNFNRNCFVLMQGVSKLPAVVEGVKKTSTKLRKGPQVVYFSPYGPVNSNASDAQRLENLADQIDLFGNQASATCEQVARDMEQDRLAGRPVTTPDRAKHRAEEALSLLRTKINARLNSLIAYACEANDDDDEDEEDARVPTAVRMAQVIQRPKTLQPKREGADSRVASQLASGKSGSVSSGGTTSDSSVSSGSSAKAAKI